MYYLGIDVGSSSVKLALTRISSGEAIAVVQQPKTEMEIHAPEKGWAEQAPEAWWNYVCKGIHELKTEYKIASAEIKGIGIAYQMHGLVLVDHTGRALRESIIWCDSRAVAIGDVAYEEMGTLFCDETLLNSPGNFTASKLKWVQENEPEVFKKIYKFMLPGDYIAYRFSNQICTTASGLSEGILWNFKKDELAESVLNQYGLSKDVVPELVDTFGLQGTVAKKGAAESGLAEDTPILYRAGDQPNNALSLNVFQPGEVATTGGTSGVVYAVTDTLEAKECSRINHFVHVNHIAGQKRRIGKLLCINGAGIQYRWLQQNLDVSSYDLMNQLAEATPVGSNGLVILPFGNGAERMLGNKELGTQILYLDLNRHTKAHMCRAALEGIAFSFCYGMELLQNDGLNLTALRTANDNLFQSELFATTIATLLQQNIEVYATTGAIGAARACVIHEKGHQAFSNYLEQNDHITTYTPLTNTAPYKKAYNRWKAALEHHLNS